MNERIRELEKQSVFYNEDEEIWETDLKKFAELIVRECIAITNDQYFAYEAVEALQKRFGVEK